MRPIQASPTQIRVELVPEGFQDDLQYEKLLEESKNWPMKKMSIIEKKNFCMYYEIKDHWTYK